MSRFSLPVSNYRDPMPRYNCFAIEHQIAWRSGCGALLLNVGQACAMRRQFHVFCFSNIIVVSSTILEQSAVLCIVENGRASEKAGGEDLGYPLTSQYCLYFDADYNLSQAKFTNTTTSKRYLIAISGIPGSGLDVFIASADLSRPPHMLTSLGKTTLASLVARRINDIHAEKYPGCASTPVAAFIPMDGYHLSRAQLSAMPDPGTAHSRRGAAFTFDDASFLELVKDLRKPLLPESKTLYAPSFDHAVKDPVADDIPIHPSARVVIFEGNYLSLNKGLWKEAAELMDELWFAEVGFETARKRLVERHVKAGIAKDTQEAGRRADENDLVNGKEIVEDRMDVQEVVLSREDPNFKPDAQGLSS